MVGRSTPSAARPPKALMILGTASHVGKSILAAGLCRILSNSGVRVAPFKAQNMSLNSFATRDGGEIGRAQALQAEACRIPATVDMNPVLLKPSSDTTSQVIVRGRVRDECATSASYGHRVLDLFPTVVASYRAVASAVDVVVLEGAGSPAEINLRTTDIVNMRMAAAADAACLLIGDIDRGGVFASLVGTMKLLRRPERRRIRGFAINKFRGDQALLRPGVTMVERQLNRRCLGIVPYLHDLDLDDEDSVSLADPPARASWDDAPGADARTRRLRVGVIALPHLSNFTDFDALRKEPSVSVAYIRRALDVPRADLLVIPGTKQTLHDLQWLRDHGLAAAIVDRARRAQSVTLGICGGMQILGSVIRDPFQVEGGRTAAGLALLPLETELHTSKVTVQARVSQPRRTLFGQPVEPWSPRGYEIHMGRTFYDAGVQPLWTLRREPDRLEVADGAVSSDERVVGTYLHGVLDDDDWRHQVLGAARRACGLAARTDVIAFTRDRDGRLDRLARHVEDALDVDGLRRWVGLPPTRGASGR